VLKRLADIPASLLWILYLGENGPKAIVQQVVAQIPHTGKLRQRADM
jgi:hypothetical protein